MRRLLWILLTVLTLVLFVLVLRQNDAMLAELTRFDSSSLETKIIALALIGVIAAALFRQRFTHVLESVLIWIVIALLLALGYTYRFELRDVADRVLAELIPGRAATKGRTVEVARGSQNLPSCSPNSTVIALTIAFIGMIMGFTQRGMSSSGFFVSSLVSLATAMMSISCAIRYTARTRCAVDASNQRDPTATFHFGCRGLIRSSRSWRRWPPGS